MACPQNEDTGKTFWQITDDFIEAVLARYKDADRDELNQVFMRGPFCGWSERNLLELAEQMDKNRKDYPLWPRR